jgi:hypothetical protein
MNSSMAILRVVASGVSFSVISSFASGFIKSPLGPPGFHPTIPNQLQYRFLIRCWIG